ncbi:Predicted metal-dependent phosphohydrolase, HD superfamily [Thalassolituus maritimus]|uniref:Predicted metal-dependent phosphohydrolase, HD superfamily n=1 Tax=Thalassolituus maritimus TaxID=484498 RepID=A0A1N7KQU8_9GAMM|nr:hypothetical protein [Thalassolituus maritimus]SIS63790.1 Predicted metal-dependent phosphohydrolase, HD superfamily [Thalassolituus maritimus]
MRTKIGNYKLTYLNREKKDWRRKVLTEFGLLANIWISGFYIPFHLFDGQDYASFISLGCALILSLLCCFGLYRLQGSPVRQLYWLENIPVLIIEFSAGVPIFYLLIGVMTGDFSAAILFFLAAIYALPFIFDYVLPSQPEVPKFFGTLETDDNSPSSGSRCMTKEELKESWNRCWSGIGAAGDGVSLKNDLVTAWNEPQRKYHTLQHLHECLSIFEEFQHLAEHPHEVELAIWFHDAVYDIKGKNNEQKSAEWARAVLHEAGVSKERITRIYDLIMATEHSVMDELDTSDKRLLVDIDLAILGSSPKRFAEYDKQVRAEYSYVPGFLYRRKRKQILQSFLKRNPIYQTPDLKLRFELQARRNLSC